MIGNKRNRFRMSRKSLAAFLLGVCMLIVSGCGSSEEAASLNPRMIADINKPGVVLIMNVYKAQIAVQDYTISKAGNQQLLKMLSQRLKRGDLPNKQALISAYFDEIVKNPSAYLVPSAHTTQEEAKGGCMGTGFIVTEDGYIVTNAHVVYASDEELQKMLAQSALQKIVKKDMQGFQADLSSNGYSLTEDEMKRLEQVITGFYAKHLKVSQVQQQVYAVLGMGKLQDGFACEVKKRGDPIPGKDIAVLKAAKNHLPVVELGDDSSMQAGDKVFVLGYPGVATFNDALSQDAKLESTFTSGMLSARKTMTGNWDVLQIDAAITNGNSGGPVFNEAGQVIGVATFGSLNEQGNQIQGMNFAIPVRIVREFLADIQVTPQSGELTAGYRAAVDSFDNGQYEDALEAFTEFQSAYPDVPYVQEFLDQSKAAIDKGK